jgi:hypothetical protein
MIKEIQERDEGKYIFKSPSSPRKCEAKARTPWKSRTSVLYTKIYLYICLFFCWQHKI